MQRRLRLDGDDSSTKAAKCGNPIANVSTDIEDQVTRYDELRIELVHCARPRWYG